MDVSRITLLWVIPAQAGAQHQPPEMGPRLCGDDTGKF